MRSGLSLLLLASSAALLLAGCSSNSSLPAVPAVHGMSGSVHGGQQPIVGAKIQLYEVDSYGRGATANPLLSQTVLTDANGNFNITGLYHCPLSFTPVYLTATGGSPSAGVTNPQIALMAAIGYCSSLTPSTFLNVNELTTVAAVYSLAPFMSSYSAIGYSASSPSDYAAVLAAFNTAGELVDITTGTAPGPGLPAGVTFSLPQLNTIADILGACINSAGGVSGDPSPCGQFFALTLPPASTTPPTNAIGALLNLANNPTLNTAALYSLIPPSAPFQPIVPSSPANLALPLSSAGAFTVTPGSLTFRSAVVSFLQPHQFVTISNGTSASVAITSITVTGPNASDFSLSYGAFPTCYSPLPANSVCGFEVSFTPTGPGPRQASIVIKNSSANPVNTVALNGSATAGTAGPVTLTPSTAAITYNGSGPQFTLTNNGSTLLTIDRIVTASLSYGINNGCGSTLPAGASCTFFAYARDSAAPPTGTLTVVDDAAAGPQIVNLTYAGSSFLNFPSTVDFGHTAVGASFSDFLQLDGPGVSGGYEFSIVGPDASDFSFGTLIPPTSCSYDNRFQRYCFLNFTFSPSSTGTRTAYFVIPGRPPYTLTGTGDPSGPDFDLYALKTRNPPYYAAPITSLDLGSTPKGTTAGQSFTINSTGTTPLSLNTPVISGPNAAEFSVSNPACATQCMPQITFSPTAIGVRTATITYTDSTGGVIRTLGVTGASLGPVPTVTATGPFFPNIDFSNIPIGTVSAAQTVSVSAYQNDPVQLSFVPVYLGGPQPFVFTGPSSCPSTPCQISIAYAPKFPYDDNANVYVTATDTVDLASASIQASGQVGPLPYYTYTPQKLTFTQTAGTVSTQNITISSVGTAPVPMAVTLNYPANPFTIVNHCPVSIPVGATCTISVTYAPTASGTTDANSITLNGPYAAGVTISGISQ